MLTAERHERILSILERKGSVTTAELMHGLDASESTIRRDITALAKEGRLQKVHGGAVALMPDMASRDEEVLLRRDRNMDEKILIARYAAEQIANGDFVYLDAGTTTDVLIDYVTASDVIFVTNDVSHARRIVERGFTCYLLGGEFKSVTDAIVGEEAVVSVRKYNFTKGFFGANGVTVPRGFTTPEVKEALVKEAAMQACRKAYVLADSSKFGQVASVSFGAFQDAEIITAGRAADVYNRYSNVTEVTA